MKHFFWVLPLLVLALAVSPVAASFVNTTELIKISGGEYKSVQVTPHEADYYESEEGFTVIQESTQLQDDDATLTTVFTFSSGTEITRTIITTPTGIFSGQYTVTYSGGNTYVIPYYRIIPWSGQNAPILLTRYVANSTSGYYIFTDVGSASSDPINTAVHAYASVYSPAEDPIISITQSSTSSALITYRSVATDNLPDMVKYTDRAAIGAEQENLIQMILDAAVAILVFLNDVVEFAGVVLSIGTLILTIEVFLVLNAAYLIWAIADSFAFSADIIKSLKKFMRYMTKLLKFYMDVFKDLKEILKWW